MKNTASTVNKGFGGMLRGLSVGFTGLTTSIGGLVSGIGTLAPVLQLCLVVYYLQVNLFL